MTVSRAVVAGLVGAAGLAGVSLGHAGAAQPSHAPAAGRAPRHLHESLARCATADLSGRLAGTEGAAGHREAWIDLINATSRSCTLRGYPGLLLLTGRGRVLSLAVLRSPRSFAGVVPLRAVTLGPGDAARVRLTMADVPTGAERCPIALAVRVIPPGSGTALLVGVPQGIAPCGRRLTTSPVALRPRPARGYCGRETVAFATGTREIEVRTDTRRASCWSPRWAFKWAFSHPDLRDGNKYLGDPPGWTCVVARASEPGIAGRCTRHRDGARIAAFDLGHGKQP